MKSFISLPKKTFVRFQLYFKQFAYYRTKYSNITEFSKLEENCLLNEPQKVHWI